MTLFARPGAPFAVAGRMYWLSRGRLLRRYTFIPLAAALILYGNVIGPWPRQDWTRPPLVEGAYLLVFVAIFAWARWVERLSPADVGISRLNLGWSLAWGAAAGAAMAVVPVAFFAFPLVAAQPVRYDPYVGLEPAAFLSIGLVRPLLDTALFEEVAFRGVLQAVAIRALGVARGIGFTCVCFVLWHAVITYQTIQLTNLTGAVLPFPLLFAASAVPLAAAGLIFSAIRQATGNLAGCVLAHWLVNSLMRVFLYLQPLATG